MTELGHPARTPEIVKAALLDAEDRILDAVEEAARRVPNGQRLLDELERAIEEVTDARLYEGLRRILSDLDEEREEILRRCRDVNVYPGLDPLRIALRDLEAGFV